MNPHRLWLSIDNPAPPHHRIMRDIWQPFKCPKGIDIGFTFSSLGPICFGDRRCVGILSSLGVERMGPFSKRKYLIRWATRSRVACAHLTTWSWWPRYAWNFALEYGFASDLVNDRRMGDPRPREPVDYINNNEGNLLIALMNTPSNSPSRYIPPREVRSTRSFAIGNFLLSNSVCWVTPYPDHHPMIHRGCGCRALMRVFQASNGKVCARVGRV